jgi:hypothetical protein
MAVWLPVCPVDSGMEEKPNSASVSSCELFEFWVQLSSQLFKNEENIVLFYNGKFKEPTDKFMKYI